jgi:hypothetical protein
MTGGLLGFVSTIITFLIEGLERQLFLSALMKRMLFYEDKGEKGTI